jgi:hypothetical protein
MEKIIFDTATGAFQGFTESLIVLVPEDMDGEELEFELAEGPGKFEQQTIVAWEDVYAALDLILAATDVEPALQADILAELTIAVGAP